MKTVTLSGSPRANVGRADATRLRNEGKVPCVIYGGKEQIHFSADEKSFKSIIYTPDVCQIAVEVNGKTYQTFLQEAQYHRLTDKLIHADFLEIVDGKPIMIQIPVKTVGTAVGVRNGGKLTIKVRKLKVRGLAAKLPDTIDVNVETLEIGKSVAVGDIKIDGIEILNPKNISVVSVNTTRAVAQAEQAAAKDDKKAAPAKK
ncbi:MAG: 50S ribosomal protein L25/general stress protein Ctc [Bacteroidota bacterium]|nr:50S ribosomal protein L25/general stress protein Ctc [Bacteroidota bacterium]